MSFVSRYTALIALTKAWIPSSGSGPRCVLICRFKRKMYGLMTCGNLTLSLKFDEELTTFLKTFWTLEEEGAWSNVGQSVTRTRSFSSMYRHDNDDNDDNNDNSNDNNNDDNDTFKSGSWQKRGNLITRKKYKRMEMCFVSISGSQSMKLKVFV